MIASPTRYPFDGARSGRVQRRRALQPKWQFLYKRAKNRPVLRLGGLVLSGLWSVMPPLTCRFATSSPRKDGERGDHDQIWLTNLALR